MAHALLSITAMLSTRSIFTAVTVALLLAVPAIASANNHGAAHQGAPHQGRVRSGSVRAPRIHQRAAARGPVRTALIRRVTLGSMVAVLALFGAAGCGDSQPSAPQGIPKGAIILPEGQGQFQ